MGRDRRTGTTADEAGERVSRACTRQLAEGVGSFALKLVLRTTTPLRYGLEAELAP
jgi:hypothetical protein